MIDVTAAILQNNIGDILIAKRKKGKALEGFWEFPGGKVEVNETPKECLIRELKEEMSINVLVEEYVGESIYEYEGKNCIRLLAFKGRIISGEINLKDHDQYKWVSIKELKEVKLAPADIPIIEMI
jgi:8-oxo-dGTP diphosphatase